ncbi:MAG: AsnC family transcriptional regulator [Acinetobacter sp.]
MNMDIDQIDQQILFLLKADSRLTHKQIGEQVHRSGQAVGLRIQRLMDFGILQSYTINIHYQQQQFIRLFMQQPKFAELEEIVNQFVQVNHCYKVAGEACYLVIAHFDHAQLALFVDKISSLARYTVETVMHEVDLNSSLGRLIQIK